MKFCAAIAIVLVSMAVMAQDAEPLDVVMQAYRAEAVADRMVIEVPRQAGPAAKSEMTVAVRTGASPAVAISMGGANPLLVSAEPGRLVAWRAGDASRVYLAPLPEPFGREAIETVLPPLFAPQLDLAFAEAPGRMLAFMPPLSWSLVASGTRDRFAGVTIGATLELTVHPDGRLAAIEARRDGRIVAKADVEQVDVDPAWFESPPLDADLDVEIVTSLADLGDEPRPVRTGSAFGDAIGTDARGRVVTLRGVAADSEQVVVLALSASAPGERARLVGELAEARLAEVAARFETRLVLLVIGDASSSRLVERVTRTSRADAGRVRAIAVEQRPRWLGEIGEGVAYAIDGEAWAVITERSVAPADKDSNVGAVPFEASPFEASTAPRSLAERLAEAVGAAMRAQ